MFLPSYFDYNDYLNWIVAHNYQSIPDTYGFNSGNIAQYPSADLALNVVCNMKNGCDNFIFWPFDKTQIGMMYFQPEDPQMGGIKLSSLTISPEAPASGVIKKIYIPKLDQTFKPSAERTKSDMIGKKGKGNWEPFEHIRYNETIMVVYLDIAHLQSQNIQLLFEEVPECNTFARNFQLCPINSDAQYYTTARPLKRSVELINGTTWRLISRHGVGPGRDGEPSEMEYSYGVSNGISTEKSFNLGVTLGLDLSGGFVVVNADISTSLSTAWGSTVAVSSSTESTLVAKCSNMSNLHSKVCPIYELMATTAINAPGFETILNDLNAPNSKTPDVKWYLGESNFTDDGKPIGTIYPIGGVFSDGISITQMADYLVPLNSKDVDVKGERCSKQIYNESNQPWALSGSPKQFGNPEYQFEHCAPFSPEGICIVLPKKTVTYSANFSMHQGYLHLVDINGDEIKLAERNHALSLSSCPYIEQSDSTAIRINEPTEGDLHIVRETVKNVF